MGRDASPNERGDLLGSLPLGELAKTLLTRPHGGVDDLHTDTFSGTANKPIRAPSTKDGYVTRKFRSDVAQHQCTLQIRPINLDGKLFYIIPLGWVAFIAGI